MLQIQPPASARQAVIFCATCGVRHGLWTFLGGPRTAVHPRWPAGSPLPPILSASRRGNGAGLRRPVDPEPRSAPAKSRALGSDAAATAGGRCGVQHAILVSSSLPGSFSKIYSWLPLYPF